MSKKILLHIQRFCFAFQTYCLSPCFVAVAIAKAPYQLSHNGHRKCSLFIDPLFSLTNQSSVRLKNKNSEGFIECQCKGVGGEGGGGEKINVLYFSFLPSAMLPTWRPLLLLYCVRENVVCAIKCRTCNKVYIGKTGRRIGDRLREHIHFTRLPDTDLPVGRHFTSRCHRIGDMLVSVVRFGFRSTTERRSFEASVIFRHQILEPAWMWYLKMNVHFNFIWTSQSQRSHVTLVSVLISI